jgi:uncharacterized protein (DUF952 family)
MRAIFKLCPAGEWQRARRTGLYHGSAADRRDGYVHLSTAEQVAETAARHFAGVPDLVLAAVDADALGAALRWEPSRGGALFPHLYAPLRLAHVLWVEALPIDASGRHTLPDLSADRGRPPRPQR